MTKLNLSDLPTEEAKRKYLNEKMNKITENEKEYGKQRKEKSQKRIEKEKKRNKRKKAALIVVSVGVVISGLTLGLKDKIFDDPKGNEEPSNDGVRVEQQDERETDYYSLYIKHIQDTGGTISEEGYKNFLEDLQEQENTRGGR